VDNIIDQALIIWLLPLAAFTIQIFFGKRLPRSGDWVPTVAIFASLILAINVFGQVLSAHDPELKITRSYEWIQIDAFKLGFGILFDNLTAVMLVVVTLVSSLVHLFSIDYMHGDVRYSRYFAFLSLFSFSMLGLVLVDGFFGIYIFWELVGLGSYLLIGHWYEKKSASDAAIKAFITTRIGDIGMFIGILIIFASLGTLNFAEVFQGIGEGKLAGGLLTAAGIGIFFGAIGKSAQFPLHVWLPDAMEGPTPVSALIHAATMVAAGVYLVGRTFLIYTSDALLFIGLIGTITAFIAATIAITQMDIKKVLAYSTISQLGYMIASLGVGGASSGGYSAGLFHLMTHAFFKALLFLASGSVIHAMHHSLHHLHDHDTDPQDMRNMGGLKQKMPITFFAMFVATLAISGVPGLSGFFSKDAILASALEAALTSHNPMHMVIFVTLLLCAGITAFYMFRLIFLTFFGTPRLSKVHTHAHESPLKMTVPLIVLAVLSIVGGYGDWFEELVRKPEMAGALAATGAEHTSEAAHSAHSLAMFFSILAAGIGILLSMMIYYWKKISADDLAMRFKGVHKFLWNKWYFDEMYNATAIAGTLVVSRISAVFDLKIIDGAVNGVAKATVAGSWLSGLTDNRVVDGLVNLVARVIGWFGGTLREIQTGKVQSYILAALGALVLFYVLQMVFA